MENELDYKTKETIFTEFIEEYKQKNLIDKQTILVNNLKEIIATLQQICFLKGINHELLLNKEIADINKISYTEDDFAEAIYVYIESIKDILATILIPTLNEEN